MTTQQPEQAAAQVFTKEDRGIEYAGLAGIKYHLRLQSKGMKSSGGSIRRQVAKQFGLKPLAPYEDYIAKCEQLMQEILEEKATKAAAIAAETKAKS